MSDGVQPKLSFFTNGSPEAEWIRKILVNAGVRFSESQKEGNLLPAVEYGGVRYHDLGDILRVINDLAINKTALRIVGW